MNDLNNSLEGNFNRLGAMAFGYINISNYDDLKLNTENTAKRFVFRNFLKFHIAKIKYS